MIVQTNLVEVQTINVVPPTGVYVADDSGTKRWFQTDLQSKIVYLIVVQTRSSMTWRTMDKENIILSDSLALRILQAVLEKESILELDEYNYLVGWPKAITSKETLWL